MSRWPSLLALTGCAQLAGIDGTSKAPDAASTTSSLQIEHVAVGKSIARGPQDLTANLASYLVPDDTAPGGLRKVAASLSGLDTWIADVGETPMPIMYESPELPAKVLRILDLPSRQLKATVPVLEKPAAEPAIPMATVAVSVNLNTAQAAETYQLFTIGAWININLPAPAATALALNSGPITLATTNSPIRRLDKFTTDDLVMVLRYSGSKLVAHLDAAPFDQAMANTITGNLAATPLNQPLNLTVNQTAAIQRVSTVRPAVGAPTLTWRVNASPGGQLNIQTGPQLDAANVGAADPSTINVMYGNPFAANLPALLTWSATATRTYTNNAITVGLTTQLVERAQPTGPLTLTFPAGLPDRITANSTVLNVDNLMVMAPANAPVEVSFITDGQANTLYHVELFELVPNGMTFTLTRVVIATSTMPAAKIPRDLFKDGALYVIRAHSVSGCFSSVATGDLSQVTQPCATAFADSGVFQVVTP